MGTGTGCSGVCSAAGGGRAGAGVASGEEEEQQWTLTELSGSLLFRVAWARDSVHITQVTVECVLHMQTVQLFGLQEAFTQRFRSALKTPLRWDSTPCLYMLP